ncbi:MAG: ATP-dependent DNA helicase RecQ [Cytophagales bacterium]
MTTPSEILQKYWGYSTFREPQLDIINSILNKKDTLALMPTGGGKSICFQIPGLLLGGLTLVITPLVALMKDQVGQLKKREIRAAYIDAGMKRNEVEVILENTALNCYDFLYISPERLQSDRFFQRLASFNVKLLAVDEAHCISQWGYDFRPSYLKIAKIRDIYPEIPIVAVTATATPDVAQDIVVRLQMLDAQVFRKSFARANLSYSVFEVEDKNKKALEILKNVPGSSVVYVRSRKKTKIIADGLLKAGMSASYYHAGLSYEERSLKQEQWIKGKTRIMVATIAFGMGIDKPDVRTVIHIDIPDSLEAYYQEAGRAGRDEKKAYAVALFSTKDIDLQNEQIKQQYPDIEYIKKVYQALANYLQVATGGSDQSFDFDLVDFQTVFKLDIKSTFFALKHLEQQGLIVFNESFYQPSALFVPDHELLYQFQVANAKYDGFVRTILRIYGGEIYTDFVVISEKVLAEKLKVDVSIIVMFLQTIDKAGILIYKQQKDAPQISFVGERYALANLPFDSKYYHFRKGRAAKNLLSVHEYLSKKVQCRTLSIQHYFGEATEKACGVCDYCLSEKKILLKDSILIDSIAEIRLLLADTALLPENLLSRLQPKSRAFFREAITHLLESKLVVYGELGVLKLA